MLSRAAYQRGRYKYDNGSQLQACLTYDNVFPINIKYSPSVAQLARALGRRPTWESLSLYSNSRHAATTQSPNLTNFFQNFYLLESIQVCCLLCQTLFSRNDLITETPLRFFDTVYFYNNGPALSVRCRISDLDQCFSTFFMQWLFL